jgi:hypothetical protein
MGGLIQTNIATFRPSPYTDGGIMVIVGNILQTVDDIPSDLQTFGQGAIASHQALYPDFNLMSSGPTTLAGNPAYKFVFNASDQNRKFIGMQIWTIKDQRMYGLVHTIQAERYSDNLPTIQRMVDSFELIG